MIAPYHPRYRQDLIEICYRTGFYGKDLTGTGLFGDKTLFGLRFCLHYPEFAPDLAFVALKDDRAVGYIIGTTDTAAQKADFARRMIPRIQRRLWLNTFWRDRDSFTKMRQWVQAGRKPRLESDLLTPYPAHLHINLLPESQGLGMGSALMDKFLSTLRERGSPGVHLGTSSANEKAVPFYKKLGFDVLQETPGDMWKTGQDLKSIVFGMKL